MWEWMTWMTLGFCALTKQKFVSTSLVNLPRMPEATRQRWNLPAKTRRLPCISSPFPVGPPYWIFPRPPPSSLCLLPYNKNQCPCPLGSDSTYKKPTFTKSITQYYDFLLVFIYTCRLFCKESGRIGCVCLCLQLLDPESPGSRTRPVHPVLTTTIGT